MEFHPSKCSVLRFTNKQHPVCHIYNIHDIPLSIDKSAKYLGVTLDDSLSWDPHINSIYQKASFTLSFLERNLQKCPPHIKAQCYNSLVRPILEYGCCAWDPHLVTQIDKLEKINKRAARFVTGNHTREHGNTRKNMKSLGWQPLQERRAKLKVTMLFKIKEDLIASKDCHLFSFFPSAIRLWNTIPDSVKAADSLSGFKSAIENYTISSSYN